jgi:hypothetical protein
MRCSEQTLAKYATQGCGPEYHRYGRDVVYVVEKLDEWAQTRLSPPVRSTSQSDAPAALGAASEHSAAAAQSLLDGGGQLATLPKGNSSHLEASAAPAEVPSRSATAAHARHRR